MKLPDNNKHTMIGNNVRYDRENLGETRELQQQKFGNTMPIGNDRSQYQSQNHSNSKSYYVETKILKHPDKNENKMIGNNVGYDGENPSETTESQQQKC